MRVHGGLIAGQPADAHDPAFRVHRDRAELDAAAFRASCDGLRVVLTGDVDAFGAERLGRVLAASPVDGDTCALDLTGLGFADVAGCRAIARWARSLTERGIRVELRNAPALVERAWHLLALDEWVTVSFTEAG
ncbi:STAS domain-containing protein [Blastococcus sp. SYSU DS0539]